MDEIQQIVRDQLARNGGTVFYQAVYDAVVAHDARKTRQLLPALRELERLGEARRVVRRAADGRGIEHVITAEV